jgi:hypothetical protein
MTAALSLTLAPAASAAAYDSHLMRAPYLTDLVGVQVTVNWATDRSATTGSARYGIVSGGTCNPTTTVAATKIAFTIGSAQRYQWKAKIALPTTGTYCYRVYLGATDLLATNASPQFSSQVPAGSGSSYSFAVFGDWGQVDANGQNADQANVMNLIAQSGVRFAVTTGDNSYPSGSQQNYGDLVTTGSATSGVFGPQFWAKAGGSIPLFPVIGNHGLSRSDANHPHLANWPQDNAVATSGGRYQKDTYCCPNGSASASYPSAWYAFEAGNARFYMLDAAWADGNKGTATPYANDYATHWTSSSPEYQWLQADLAAHPAALKFAFFHYPLYSDQKSETSDTFLQGNSSLEGLLASNGVDIAFSGHAHIYQRNAPASGAGRLGLVSYTTGGGGGEPQSIGPCGALTRYAIGWSDTKQKGTPCGSAPAPTSRAQIFHFLKVTVNGNQVTVTPTNSLGQTFDVQTYSFNGPPPDTTKPSTPTNLAGSAPNSTQVNLSWTAATDNVGVTGYDVIRNGALLASIGATTSFSDTTVAGSTAYQYTVQARDAAGNVSDPTLPLTVTTPAANPPVFSDGFESGNLSAWTSSGGLTVQGTTLHSGAFAAQGNTTNGATYAKKTLPSTYNDAFARVWFNRLSGPDQVNLLRFRTSAGTSLGYLYLSTTGQLGFRNDTAATSTLSATIPDAGWHSLELHVTVNGTASTVQVWLDGAVIGDLGSTSANLGTVAVGQLQIGEVQTGRTYNVAFDDAAFGTTRLGG